MLLVEYLNYVNLQGKSIGHGKKVLNETVNLISKKYKVKCTSSVEYKPLSSKIEGFTTIEEIPSNIKGIRLNSKIFNNIRKVLRDNKEEVIWFTNVEWRLLAYLAFFRFKQDIVITMYRDIYGDIRNGNSKLKRLKAFLIKKGLNKVQLVVVTNPNLKVHRNQVYLPDYYYEDKYKYFHTFEKVERVLCVGNMRASKDLFGLIDIFNYTDVSVLIVGNFDDKDFYKSLKEKAKGNVKIEDRVVDYDEYCKMIAESRFVIMPYDMKAYRDATSGILLETMFLDSIPIAPERLLRYNSVDGIGYEELKGLPTNYSDLIKFSENIVNTSESYDIKEVFKKLDKKLLELDKIYANTEN